MVWRSAHSAELCRYRELLAACTNYAFFCQSESDIPCESDHLGVDREGGNIIPFESKGKGAQRTGMTAWSVFQVLI